MTKSNKFSILVTLKGEEILNKYLTDKESLDFVASLAGDRKFDFIMYEIDWVFPQELIMGSFDWRNAIGGSDYWFDIYTRVEQGVYMGDSITPKRKLFRHKLTW